MRHILLLGALATLAAHAHEIHTLETAYFRADLTTANEVPAVTAVNGSARAIIAAHMLRDERGTIVSAVVDFDVDYNFADGDGTFTGLHIHDGAAGVNGPVTINTGLASADAVTAQGTGNIFRAASATSAAAIATIKSMLVDPSKHYVNLHTSLHTGGVVRAQLSRAETRVIRATLDPANEVPAVTSDGRGSGNLIFLATRDANGNINAGTVTFETAYSFGSPVTFSGWHIHTGAAGVNGAVVINTTLAATNADVQNVTSGTVRRRVDVTSGTALAALQGIWANPANYYLNIHTTAFPAGVMRGQLEPTARNTYQILMDPDQEIPFVTGLSADATATVTVYSSRNAAGAVNSATVVFDVTHEFPGSTTFTGLHIHSGAPGIAGPVVINTGIGGTATVTDADGAGNIYRAVDVSPLTPTALAAVQGLFANPTAYYVNLHTTVNPGGAVRGVLNSAPPGRPIINKGGILNNASYAPSVSPGSIAAIFGTDLTNGALCLSTEGCIPRFSAGKMGTSMGGTSATVNGIPAPVFYATPTQLGVQIPVEATGSTATIAINADGLTSAPETVPLEAAAPGVFSMTGDGRGPGAITHVNGALVTPANPAARGETLVLYATGLGAMTPIVPTGTLPADLSRAAAQPTLTVAGIPAAVLFAGHSGCCAGLNQINFTIPTGAPVGNSVSVVVSVNAKPSNQVTIAVQ
jgi:uncharacterized protein (TIGR03437 family)